MVTLEMFHRVAAEVSEQAPIKLPPYLRERLSTDPKWRFFFYVKDVELWQCLVAISVPGKPARKGSMDGFAFWYVNGRPLLEDGAVNGLEGSTDTKDWSALATEDDLRTMLEKTTSRLATMITKVY